MTTLEIVDTAVKIGLGAVISGMSAYSITRLQQKGELQKEKRTRKRELFEKVSTQITLYDSAFRDFFILIENLIIEHGSNEDLRCGISKERYKLQSAEHYISDAEANLLLLNEINIYEALRGYSQEISNFALHARDADEGLQRFDIEDLKYDSFKRLRETLFKLLSDRYLSI